MKRIIFICMFIGFGFLFAQNNALDFDGSDDYVDCGNNASLNPGSGSFTIEAWINGNAMSGIRRFVWKNNGHTPPFDGYYFMTTGTDLEGGFGDATNYVEVVGGPLSANKWYHVALVRDKSVSKVYLYLNGIKIDEETDNTGDVSYSENLAIGGRPGATTEFFAGIIDEVRIWNDARTEAEIRANMYQELAGTESGLVVYYKFNETSGTNADDSKSDGTNDGTLTNMDGNTNWVTSAAFAGPKNCLDFDGTEDYVNCGTSLSISGDLTVSAWIKSYGVTSSSENPNDYIVARGDDADKKNSFGILLAGQPVTHAALLVNTAIPRWATSPDGSIETNTWYHIAGVISGSTAYIYINGVLAGQETITGSISATNLNLNIGRQERTSYEYYFHGLIDEVCIWDKALTASQIRENMCKSLTGNEDGLVAYYNFDNSSGTTLQDFSGNANDGTLTNMADEDWVSPSAFNTWLNTSSSSWSTAANWSRGSVPDSSDNAGIYSYTGGTNVYLSGTPTVNNLLLGGSSAMTLSSAVTVTSNLILESNLNLNGQTVTLGSAATLVEGTGRLYGSSGTITTTRSLSDIDENVAGLGAEITTSANMGNTTITRSHAAPGSQAIERKYYINPTTNTGLDATLVFHYDDSELNGKNESELKLFKSSDGSTWTELSSSIVNTTSNTLTLSGIDAFSYWTAAPTGSDQSLPVELSSFTAENRSSGVILKWSTESEDENLGFLISRKLKVQSSKWEEIASYLTDAVLEGHGSTTEKHDYEYTDKAVQQGITYEYRLGDVDYGGAVIWHKTVEITVDAESATLPMKFGLQRVYPNPFNPALTIRYGLIEDGQVSLKVYNLRGELIEVLISTYKLKGTYSITWQPQNLSAGIYFIHLQSGNRINLQKVVFVK